LKTSICNAGFGCARQKIERPALLMLGTVAAFMRACLHVAVSAKAGEQKLSCSIFIV
jgi:hypothetical protein